MLGTVTSLYGPGQAAIAKSCLPVCRREDAVRLGLFIGGFTGLYSGAKDCLHRWRPSTGASAQCFAAGTIAGANWIFVPLDCLLTVLSLTLSGEAPTNAHLEQDIADLLDRTTSSVPCCNSEGDTATNYNVTLLPATPRGRCR